MNDETLEVSGSCDLITVDKRELKLLREIAESIPSARRIGYTGKLLEALEPWSRTYGENQL